MYEIHLKPQPRKKLVSLPRADRNRISEKLVLLADDPDDKQLDVKKMAGFDTQWRLRVGQWRVVFDRLDVLKIIEITKIGARGDVYK